MGASATLDGANLIGSILNNAIITPIEIIETEYPVRVRVFGVRRDSGGAGKRRGGLAYVREYQVLEDCSFNARLSGMKFAARAFHSHCQGFGWSWCEGGSIIRPAGQTEKSLTGLPVKYIFPSVSGRYLHHPVPSFQQTEGKDHE